MDSRSLSIRAPVSDDVEDSDVGESEDEGVHVEDDEGSFISDESYNSALEAMAIASNADAPSSVASSNEPLPEGFPSEDADIPQEGALRQLNELNSAAEDEPLQGPNSSRDYSRVIMPVAQPTDEDDDDSERGGDEDALRYKESHSDIDQVEDDFEGNGVQPNDDEPERGDDEDVLGYKESHSNIDQVEEDREGNGVQPDCVRGFRVRGADNDYGESGSARGLRVRGASDNYSEESEDHTEDINGLLSSQPELHDKAAAVPSTTDEARQEVPSLEAGKGRVKEEEAESHTVEGILDAEHAEQAPKGTGDSDGSVDHMNGEQPKEIESEALGADLKHERGHGDSDGSVDHMNGEQPEEIESEALGADLKHESNGEAVGETVPGIGSERELKESEATSSPDEAVLQPQEDKNLEQVADKSVDAVSPKQELETSLLSSSIVEDQAAPNGKIVEGPASGTEHVDGKGPSSPDVSSQFQEGGRSDEGLDAIILEHDPQDSPLSSPAVEDTAPMKLQTAEDPVSATEHSSTQAEPMAVMEENNEKGTSGGNPDAEVESELTPSEGCAPTEDVVVNQKEEEDREEEETEDDVGREKESVSENTTPLAAFVNSKASKAPATDKPSLGGAGPSLPVRPAGLGRSVHSLEHAPRAAQRSIGASPPPASRAREDNPSNSDVSDDNKEAREKLQMIRVKFLRLAHRLGQSAHNVVVAQVLYRLGLAEQLRGGRGISTTGAFSLERASVLAEEQEAAGQDELEFGCTIMVLGKSGVGKSATINSLFDEVKSGTDAYSPATKKVREITGTIHGIKLTVIDTPGLLPSFADQRHNEKVMSSVKHFIKKSPPDIVLYFDRLDMQSRDYGDLPLLRTITDTFGAAVWFNAIVVLTHASSAPPDGANGVPLSYEMFVAQRSHVVQQTIRQAAGDMRLMNPVSLVENHAACRTNRAGQRVLPNGQVWKPQLLLLCFASKILAEANSLLKLQDSSQGKPFGVRPRVPPLPFLLSSLLQSRAQLRLPDEQLGDEDLSDEDLEEEAESESDEEYDDLPTFRRLTKEELRLLDDEQRKNYFDELDYREKLFMKQQWKEERLRRREMRKRKAAVPREESQPFDESFEEENAGSAAVPVAMPDMALPPSFDSDNPSHRYRYIDTATQWLVRPVLETHGWDHDNGYDSLNIEKVFVISKKIPASVSGQITKDKKEANLQMECAASFKNGENKATLAGLDVQTIGKDLAYTLRSETWFSNFRRNKTTCGLAVTFLGDTVAAGMKLEDALMVGRRFKIVLNGGAITGRGDVAYGGSLEATLRDKDYPIVHSLSTIGLSIMDWHGDLAVGGNAQSQFMLGKTMIIARANLNNRGAGQISIRASRSEQLQMALIGLIPLLRTFFGSRIFNSAQPL